MQFDSMEEFFRTRPKWTLTGEHLSENVVHIQVVPVSGVDRRLLAQRLNVFLDERIQSQYIWFYGDKLQFAGSLHAEVRFGACYDDEYVVVDAAQQLSAAFASEILCIRVWDDADGEFLLSDLADMLSDEDGWAPEMASWRVLWSRGKLLLLRPPRTPFELGIVPTSREKLSEAQATEIMRRLYLSSDSNPQAVASFCVSADMLAVIGKRVHEAVQNQSHVCACRVPWRIAAILKQQPQVIAHAVQALVSDDYVDEYSSIEHSQAWVYSPLTDLTTSPSGMQPTEWVFVSVRFTRYLFAMLEQHIVPFPKSIAMAHPFPSPHDPQYPACERGMKLFLGFEYANKLSEIQETELAQQMQALISRFALATPNLASAFPFSVEIANGSKDDKTDWLDLSARENLRDTEQTLWRKHMESSTGGSFPEDSAAQSDIARHLIEDLDRFMHKQSSIDGIDDEVAHASLDTPSSAKPSVDRDEADIIGPNDENWSFRSTLEEGAFEGGFDFDKLADEFDSLLDVSERKRKGDEILKAADDLWGSDHSAFLKALEEDAKKFAAERALREAAEGKSETTSSSSSLPSSAATSSQKRHGTSAGSRRAGLIDGDGDMGMGFSADGSEMFEQEDDQDGEDVDIDGTLDEETQREILENLMAALQAEGGTGIGPMTSLLRAASYSGASFDLHVRRNEPDVEQTNTSDSPSSFSPGFMDAED